MTVLFDVREYYSAKDILWMRRLMRYDQVQYMEDWNLACALAMLMSAGNKEFFEPMLNSCMNRILAYWSNNPDSLPFSV
jgi:hypothetical protein